MTLTDGTELTPALGIGAFADKTLVAAGQCTKVDPAGRPGRGRPAGLRGDGRPRCGDQHRRRHPRRHRRGDRLRRRRRRRNRRRGARRRQADHRRRHRQHQAGLGPQVRCHPHRQRPRIRRRQDHPGPHRRLRRRRGHRRGRAPRNLETGLLRTRPGRNRCAGGCAHPRHAPGHAAGGLLLPRRLAEIVLVWRLPARTRLPHPDRPLPAGPAAAGEVRLRTHRPRRHRGGVPQDARRQGAALGGDVL